MIRGLYTAASGLVANLRLQEVVANNIANLSTPGYKGESAAERSFASTLVRSVGNAPVPVPLALSRTLGVLGSGTYIAERSTFLENGEIAATDGPLDLALRGQGFFAVQGATGTVYTRNGRFQRDPQGFLTTTEGLRVLGAGGEPIVLPAGVTLDQVEITARGDVLAAGVPLARLQVVEIPAIQLVRSGDTSFVVTGGATPTVSQAVVVQGALEQSNIDIGRAATQLSAVSQRFEANQRVFLTIDENLQLAVRDVGRVG